MDFFLGMVSQFAFNYAPQNWVMCNGALMSIPQNTALYALIGTTYGGDGRVSFGLPNLQGRTMVGMGTGQGLSPVLWGESGGAETATLTTPNLPAHTHVATFDPRGGTAPLTPSFQANSTPGTSTTPVGHNCISASPTGTSFAARIWSDGVGTAPVNVGALSMAGTGAVTVNPAGSSYPVAIRNPYLAMNFCIAVAGIFPQRG